MRLYKSEIFFFFLTVFYQHCVKVRLFTGLEIMKIIFQEKKQSTTTFQCLRQDTPGNLTKNKHAKVQIIEGYSSKLVASKLSPERHHYKQNVIKASFKHQYDYYYSIFIIALFINKKFY